jgi:hypothetical protein
MPRIRDFGIIPGYLSPGPLNAISDLLHSIHLILCKTLQNVRSYQIVSRHAIIG